MPRTILRDDQWERIAFLLQGKPGDSGRTGNDNRLFVEAVLWVGRTGSPWRDLPVEFEASALLADIEPEAVLADKAYDADVLLLCIAEKQAKAVIPSKSNRKMKHAFDRHHYRNRNVIERFFARIKQFRRVATRYDKLASRFMSFVLLAASMLWLK